MQDLWRRMATAGGIESHRIPPGDQDTVTDTASAPRPEHPNPLFERHPWHTLNGRWRFAFDPRDIGEQSRWYRLAHPDVLAHRRQGAGPGAGDLAASLNFEPGRGMRTGDPVSAQIVGP